MCESVCSIFLLKYVKQLKLFSVFFSLCWSHLENNKWFCFDFSFRGQFAILSLGKWSELKSASASDANATAAIMSAKKRPTFDVGARVFAKVRGYPAWPARVETVFGTGSKYSVFFYGTYESATVKPNELWAYDEASKAKHGEGKGQRTI